MHHSKIKTQLQRAENFLTKKKLAEAKNITDINMDVYIQNGLASKTDLVKILGRGELKAKLKVSAHKFTATAKAAIEAAGGEAVTL